MLNNKTKYSFLFFLTVIIYTVKGQQIYLETGAESAYFKDYLNNLGENSLDLNYSKSQEFFVEGGFRFNLYDNKIKLNLGSSYNTYQINTGFYASPGTSSVPLTYNLTYVSVKTGLIFSIINEPKFKVQVHTHFSHDWLTQGTSKYRNVVNDLYQQGTFDKTLIRFHKGLSVEYNVSDEIATYISYNIADSYREENRDSSVGDSYVFHSNAISFGILFNILNRGKPCYG